MNALEIAQSIYSHPMVIAILGLLLANIIAGVAISLYTKTFRLGEIADWLQSRALPYILGASVIQLMLMTVPTEQTSLTAGAGTVVWAFVVAALVGKVLGQLKEIGLPVPSPLTDRDKPDVTSGT